MLVFLALAVVAVRATWEEPSASWQRVSPETLELSFCRMNETAVVRPGEAAAASAARMDGEVAAMNEKLLAMLGKRDCSSGACDACANAYKFWSCAATFREPAADGAGLVPICLELCHDVQRACPRYLDNKTPAVLMCPPEGDGLLYQRCRAS